MTVDCSLADRRVKKAEQRHEYTESTGDWFKAIESGWRKAWHEHCAKHFVPWDQWVFEGGDHSPFELGCPISIDEKGNIVGF